MSASASAEADDGEGYLGVGRRHGLIFHQEGDARHPKRSERFRDGVDLASALPRAGKSGAESGQTNSRRSELGYAPAPSTGTPPNAEESSKRMQDQLVFLIGSPRSGSTMLSRMLGAHSEIYAPEEPHLITPMAHLGFYDSVESAPYDPIITRAAARTLVEALPDGEQSYLDALRAYSDQIYAGLLEQAGQSSGKRLLDKTPAYALSLDFLAKLYPQARFIVLTRHPIAVWSSFVDSFFDGDDEVAHAHNPLLERYVPAVARFLRTAQVPMLSVQYENLVQEPDLNAQKICEFLDLPYEPGMVDYGAGPNARGESTRGLGDPTTVAKETRPTTASLSKWVGAAKGLTARTGLYHEILARLGDEDLETWGYTRAEIKAELDQIDLAGKPAPRPNLTRYALERKMVVAVRRRIQPDNALGKLIKKVREACDALLR